MCVTMLARTGCRYWFRQGGALANAISKDPDSPLVAEIEFEVGQGAAQAWLAKRE